jgi:arabinan endo-1,5-alpha-L-arabinosidase
MHYRTLRRTVATIAAVVVAATVGSTASSAQAAPPAPRPVITPGEAADPGVIRVGNDYYAFLTGGRAKMAKANSPQGPWVSLGNAMPRWAGWATGTGAVWAPDVVQTSAGWVLYYAAIAKGFAGQRCVGTAVADNPAGPYEPSDTPLICPILGGEDPVADRPDLTAGVIDPAPFQDSDGQRYLLYKTQKSPGTLRMFPLSSDGLHGRGEISHELARHADSLEAPEMVKRGDYYLLFASANWYDQCRYATVWRRSTDMWSFADKTENVLTDKASTGICGPGGAEILDSGNGPSRIFLQGWVCTADYQPCQFDGQVTDPNKTRVIYAGVLTWGEDGATPQVPAFLRPISG